jgi:hypothetical protein
MFDNATPSKAKAVCRKKLIPDNTFNKDVLDFGKDCMIKAGQQPNFLSSAACH